MLYSTRRNIQLLKEANNEGNSWHSLKASHLNISYKHYTKCVNY